MDGFDWNDPILVLPNDPNHQYEAYEIIIDNYFSGFHSKLGPTYKCCSPINNYNLHRIIYIKSYNPFKFDNL